MMSLYLDDSLQVLAQDRQCILHSMFGTQTRTRSDRKYSIPERARRAIINYLSRYKTLRISVRACPPVQGKPGTVGQKCPP